MDSTADGKSDALRDLVNTGAVTVNDLRALVDTVRELAAEVNLKTLLRDILDKASKLTNSSDASVILPAEGASAIDCW